MKRNIFGINVDEGIALTKTEEFERLFVDTNIDAKIQLSEWLNEGDQPVLFGGQIGCGKTTWMEYVFQGSKIKPDIVFHFDRGNLNLSPIDSWAIVFIELFRYAAENDLVETNAIPSDFIKVLGETKAAWHASIDHIQLQSFSAESIKKNKNFNDLLGSNLEKLDGLASSLIQKNSDSKKKPLILCASGVDKFEPGTTAYFALTDVLQCLCRFKTLFEVNAVHLFSEASWIKNLNKIIIPVSEMEMIKEMLKKRLGRYAGNHINEVSLIAKYSGGIPRQALRLLDSFLAVRKKALNNCEAFAQAVENVNRDFFAFSARPKQELMRSINKDQFIEIGLVSLPGDTETAKRAVFGNWIVLKGPMNESRWSASLNPSIKESFITVTPEDPERELLREYARQTGISDFGLDINTSQSGWRETLISQIEKPIAMNVIEILDCITSALLSKQRADRIIVAFENNSVAHAVRAYFEAKSNSYEYQIWNHHLVEHDSQFSPLIQILHQFSEKSVDVYSFEFTDDYSDQELDELNIRRDSFIDRQMIWWIPIKSLPKYLNRWIQLRQLFQVYILEEDLAKSLSIQDIQADLDFMTDLVEFSKTAPFSYVENLKVVLDYLKGVVHA